MNRGFFIFLIIFVGIVFFSAAIAVELTDYINLTDKVTRGYHVGAALIFIGIILAVRDATKKKYTGRPRPELPEEAVRVLTQEKGDDMFYLQLVPLYGRIDVPISYEIPASQLLDSKTKEPFEDELPNKFRVKKGVKFETIEDDDGIPKSCIEHQVYYLTKPAAA